MTLSNLTLKIFYNSDVQGRSHLRFWLDENACIFATNVTHNFILNNQQKCCLKRICVNAHFTSLILNTSVQNVSEKRSWESTFIPVPLQGYFFHVHIVKNSLQRLREIWRFFLVVDTFHILNSYSMNKYFALASEKIFNLKPFCANLCFAFSQSSCHWVEVIFLSFRLKYEYPGSLSDVKREL